MEANKPTKKKGLSTGVIVLLVVLLLGVGVGVYLWTGQQAQDDPGGGGDDGDDESSQERESNSSQYQQSKRGRQLVSLTPEQIALLISNEGPRENEDEEGGSPENPLYYKSIKAQQIIKEQAAKMQQHNETANFIRGKYNIGFGMMTPYSNTMQGAIYDLFKVLNVFGGADPENIAEPWFYFPVVGIYQPGGKEKREELREFIDAGWEKLNLTALRDSKSPWWLASYELNLLTGTDKYTVPKPHAFWVGHHSEEREFFKRMNNYYDIKKEHLIEKFVNRDNTSKDVWITHPKARAAYCADRLWKWAKTWDAEGDRYDRMTEWEAFKWLGSPRDGETEPRWYFTYTNPDTGIDESESPENPYLDGITHDERNGNKNDKMDDN
jgi:hypothetical protein